MDNNCNDDYSKPCRTCQVVRPKSDYYKAPRNSDGLFTECRFCSLERQKSRIAKNKEKWSNSPRPVDDPYEKKCSKCKDTKHHTEFGKDVKKYDGLNPLCLLCHNNWSKDYYHSNKESVKAHKLKHYQENKDYYSQKKKEWKKANRHKVNEYENRRRARKRNLPNEVIDFELVFEQSGGVCYLCAQPITVDSWHLDHKIPLSRLELNPTHTYDNVAASCIKCNLSKGAKTVEEFTLLLH